MRWTELLYTIYAIYCRSQERHWPQLSQYFSQSLAFTEVVVYKRAGRDVVSEQKLVLIDELRKPRARSARLLANAVMQQMPDAAVVRESPFGLQI